MLPAPNTSDTAWTLLHHAQSKMSAAVPGVTFLFAHNKDPVRYDKEGPSPQLQMRVALEVAGQQETLFQVCFVRQRRSDACGTVIPKTQRGQMAGHSVCRKSLFAESQPFWDSWEDGHSVGQESLCLSQVIPRLV